MRARTTVMMSLLAVSLLAGSSCSGDAVVTTGRSFTELGLRDQQRALWVDHVTWSEQFATSTLRGLGDQDVAFGRFLLNANNLGANFRSLYGDDAGSSMTRLMRHQVALERRLVIAVGQGANISVDLSTQPVEGAENDPNVTAFKLKASLVENTDRIIALAMSVNPAFNEAELRRMLTFHLEEMQTRVVTIARQDWTGNIAAYDADVAGTRELADAFAAAYQSKFPNRVRIDRDLTADDLTLHLAMRALWSDHVMYTRFFVVHAVGHLSGTDEFGARLLQNQVDIGNAVKPIYGEDAGAQLTRLLQEHIVLAAETVQGAMGDSSQRTADAQERLYANAKAIADFLAAANPFFDQAELREMMDAHIGHLVEEVVARIQQDWLADIDAYDVGVAHIYDLADTLSAGIIEQRADGAIGTGSGTAPNHGG